VFPLEAYQITGYSDSLAAACVVLKTTYLNHVIENFHTRVQYYLFLIFSNNNNSNSQQNYKNKSFNNNNYTYKQNNNNQNNQNNQVNIFYNQNEPEKTNIDVINEIHRDLDKDLQHTLEEALKIFNFHEGVHKVENKYINAIENKVIIFLK
jgi:hypothetical protein